MTKKSDVLDIQRVGTFLSELPPLELLSIQLEPDQAKEWQRLHFLWVAISCCWRARNTGQDDPLLPGLEEGKISAWYRQYIWLIVDWLLALWGLVQSLHRYVPDYPSAFELFCEAVRTEVENNFQLCMMPYIELPTTTARDMNKAGRQWQQDKLKPANQRKVDQFFKNAPNNEALELITQVAIVKSKTDDYLAMKRQDYITARTRLLDHKLKRKSSRGAKKTAGFAWKDGRKLMTAPGGVYR